jgi:hypothetical protein
VSRVSGCLRSSREKQGPELTYSTPKKLIRAFVVTFAVRIALHNPFRLETIPRILVAWLRLVARQVVGNSGEFREHAL